MTKETSVHIKKLGHLDKEFAEVTEDNANKLDRRRYRAVKRAIAANTRAGKLQTMIGFAASLS